MGFFKALNSLFVDNSAEDAVEEERQRVLDSAKVLIIDDDAQFLGAAAQTLTDSGLQVLKSSNGAKGLNMIRYAGGDVKVVLLDYDMQQLDGLATLKFLRRIAPTIKVIAVTGVDIKFLPAAFREGVDLLVCKPFETEQIVKQIRNYFLPETAPVANAGN